MFKFKFADIGDGIIEGKILELNFNVGDKVNEGDTVAVIETDKINAELPSPVSGIIKEYPKEEGEIIYVGEVVVVIDDGSSVEEKPQDAEEKKETGASVIGEIEVSEDIIESSNETATKIENRQKALATPVARNLAKTLNLDINTIAGTGPDGRVMKEDILNANKPSISAAANQPLSFEEGIKRVALTSVRKTISKAMSESKHTIADTVLFDEVTVDDLVNLRNRTKERASKMNIKLTYLAFIAKAVIETLKQYPIFNASYDHVNEELVYKDFINLGFAVDTDHGLIVPNIKNAANLSIFDLARQLNELATKATNKTIQLDEIRNGTFTITNFGSVGVPFGVPIINYPEVAILGIGKISKKPVVENGEIKIRYVLPLSLAVDHRIIDGADAGRFLNTLKTLLNDVDLLLLS